MSENIKPMVILGHTEDGGRTIKMRLVEWGNWPEYTIDVEGWDESEDEWVRICEFAPEGSTMDHSDNFGVYEDVGLKKAG